MCGGQSQRSGRSPGATCAARETHHSDVHLRSAYAQVKHLGDVCSPLLPSLPVVLHRSSYP